MIKNIPYCINISFDKEITFDKTEEKISFFSKIEFNNFSLGTDTKNMWILTKKNNIVRLKNIVVKNEILTYGYSL